MQRVPVFQLCDWLNQEILITYAGTRIVKEGIKLRCLEQVPLLHPPKCHCKMRLRCSDDITYCRSGSVRYPESSDIKNLFSVALSFELGIMGRKNDSICILFSVCISCPEVFLSC